MEKLYSRCQNFLWVYSGICLIAIAVIVALLIILGVKHKTFDKKDHCLLGIVVAVFLGVFIFFGAKWWAIYKDYELLENGQYEVVVGTVVGYNKAQYFENGTTDYSWPIIEELDTNNRIVLDVGGTELNKTYTVYYLKNSKFGIITEEH